MGIPSVASAKLPGVVVNYLTSFAVVKVTLGTLSDRVYGPTVCHCHVQM
jgi:hypothetical protein